MVIKITNRELLRNYKEIKGKLLSGEVNEVLIKQRDGVVFRIEVKKNGDKLRDLIDRVKSDPFVDLERPEEDVI